MRVASAIFLLLTGLGSERALAATAEPWRPAPLYGADVRSLAVNPRDPDDALAGTSAGQIYRSRDGGRTWSDAGAPLPFPGWVVGSLSFDPNRPARLWGSFWGIWGGGLVAWSEDLGRTWAVPHPVRAEEQVYALAPVPGEPAVLYAGTRLGVYKSVDDGASWVKVTISYPEIENVSSLYVDALSPQTVIAGTWHRAFRSDDGGSTWRGIFTGMVDDSEVFSLHPVPWRAGELWASTCGWVYRTSDLGGKWTRYSEGFAERRTPSFAVLASGRLLAGTVAGLHASDDDGATWRRVTAPQLSVLALSSHPSRPGRVLLGSEGAGVWRSEDGGSTFVRSDQGMTNVRAAALLRTSYGLRVAVNHAGPASGIYLTRDGGRTFTGPAAVPTVLGLAAGEDAIWAATEQGLYRSRGDSFERVAEIGAARVEQVLAAGRRVVARAGQKLWQSTGGEFTAVPYRHGPPRAAALDGDALWVADAEGLYRLTADSNHSIAVPYSGGSVQSIDGLLVWSGKPGVFTRAGASAPWREAGGGPTRALETGDKACPLLLLGAESAALLSRRGVSTPLPLAVPARDVVAAAVLDGRLWLGTSGHGLLSRPLDCPD
jgi:photosystem II stability/assembly factor-like uncharacterized protein